LQIEKDRNIIQNPRIVNGTWITKKETCMQWFHWSSQRGTAHIVRDIILLGWLVGGVGVGHAAPTTFTDQLSFLAFIGSSPFTNVQTVNFDSIPAGTPVANGDTIGGITFTSSLGGINMLISSMFDTTSPDNALGIQAGDEVFFSGDVVTLTFSGPINAIGLHVIGSPGDVQANDFQLSTSVGSVFNAGTPGITLPDGGEAFFLGLADPVQRFTSATLASFGDVNNPVFFWQADDITTAVVVVPEPSILLLVSTGLGGLLWWIGGSRGASVRV
jgi:hypothetical protein